MVKLINVWTVKGIYCNVIYHTHRINMWRNECMGGIQVEDTVHGLTCRASIAQCGQAPVVPTSLLDILKN